MTDLPTPTAAEVRRDAIVRLIAAAAGHRSYRGPYNPEAMRTVSIDLLYRWALANAADGGDLDRARHELDLIYPVARGDAGALYDAVQAGGVGALLGEDQPVRPAATVDEVSDLLGELIGGAA